MKSAQSISDHLWKADPEKWAETFKTNITSQFFVAAGFLPLLSNGRQGTPGYSPSIVNITSISGVMKGSSNGQFAYATSKAGFLHLTRMMAMTFAEARIRVNSIAPGVFPSEMTAGVSDEYNKSSLEMSCSNPEGRPGYDTDMGACILFLAGPSGAFLNSQILYPDGGMLDPYYCLYIVLCFIALALVD
jgi:NAD(P)-dependent dehydrogenase (short-subunit alcohol dehydrogenase family)